MSPGLWFLAIIAIMMALIGAVVALNKLLKTTIYMLPEAATVISSTIFWVYKSYYFTGEFHCSIFNTSLVALLGLLFSIALNVSFFDIYYRGKK